MHRKSRAAPRLSTASPSALTPVDEPAPVQGSGEQPVWQSPELRPEKSGEPDFEARFLLLANTGPSILWTADPNGRITFASDQWYAFSGLTPEENATEWQRSAVHPADRERTLALWTENLRNGTPHEIEVRNRRYDGEYRWMLTRAVPVRDASGRITEWFGTTTDIHDRKIAEENERVLLLLSSELGAARDTDSVLEAFARTVVPAFADGCIVLGAGERSFDVGEGREPVTLSVHVYHPDPDQRHVLRGLAGTVPAGEAATRAQKFFEQLPDPRGFLIRKASESIRDFIASLNPAVRERRLELLHKLDAGSALLVPLSSRSGIIGFVAFVLGARLDRDAVRTAAHYDDDDLSLALQFARQVGDAIQRVRLIAAERRQHALLQTWYSAFEHSGTAMAVANPATNTIMYANGAYAAMHGYSVDEMCGMSVRDIVDPSDHATVQAMIKRSERGEQTRGELRRRRKDGSMFVGELVLTTIHGSDGAPLYRSIAVTDVTERNQRERDQQFLLDFGVRLLKASDPNTLLNEALAAIAQHFRAHRAILLTIDVEGNRQCCVADWTRDGNLLTGQEWPLDRWATPSRQKISAGEPYIIVNDVRRDRTRDDADISVYVDNGIISYTSTVLGRGNRPTALLAVADNGPRNWSVREAEVFRMTAERLWSAFELTKLVETLRVSEARTRTVLEHAAEAAWIGDGAGRYEEVNQAACELLGYSREEFLNLSALDIMAPEEHHRLPEIRAFFTRSGAGSFECTMTRKDGTRFVAEVSGRVLPDGRWQVIARDITARKQAERDQLFLLQLGELLRKTHTIQELLEAAAQMVVDHLDVDRCDWFAVDPDQEHITLSASAARRGSILPVLRVQHLADWFTDGIDRGALLHAPVVVDDVAQDPRLHPLGIAYDRKALVLAPYSVEDRCAALLAAGSNTARVWSQREVDLLQSAVERIYPAWEVLRARESAEREAERVRRLQRITETLAGAFTAEEAADLVLHEGIVGTGAFAASFSIFTDAETGRIETVRTAGFPDDVREWWARFNINDNMPASRSIRTGEPVFLESLSDWSREFPHLVNMARDLNVVALAEIPLVYEGEIFGAVAFNYATARTFTTEDRAFLDAIGHQLSQAIERARLYHAEREARWNAERANVHAQLLQELTAALADTTTREEVAQAVVPVLVDKLNALNCALAVATEGGDELEFLSVSNIPEQFLSHRRISISSTSIAAKAYRQGVSQFIESPEEIEEAAATATRVWARRLGMEAIACIALPGRTPEEACHGVIGLGFAVPRVFDPAERELLDSIGRQCAQALDRARQYDERVRAEEALRRSTAIMQAVNDSTPDLIFMKDTAGRVIYGNQALAEMFGRSLSEVLGKDDFELNSDRERATRVRANDLMVISTGHTQVFEEVSALADGDHVFLVTKSPYRNERGEVIGIIGVAHDITERKRIEDELLRHREHLAELVREKTVELEQTYHKLRAADRMAMLGTLSAGIGHDMGNLLLPIRVRLDLLESRTVDPMTREDLVAIRTAAEYLQRLTKGLRMLSLNPDDDTASPDEVSLHEWWDEMEHLMRNAVPRTVVVHVDLPANLPRVRISTHGLSQAMFNLVQNAGEALRTRPTGTIRLKAIAVEGRRSVKLIVADDGPGMPPEIKARCLEPFFTTKARGLSTGLGLALVASVVRRAGGRIEIESETDRGTSFILHLPTVPEGTERGAEGAAPKGRALTFIRDSRRRAYVTSVLKGLGLDVTADASAFDECELLLADADGTSPERVMAFLEGNVHRRAVVFAPQALSWRHARLTEVPLPSRAADLREVLSVTARRLWVENNVTGVPNA